MGTVSPKCARCGHLDAGACRATKPEQCRALTPQERAQMRRVVAEFRERAIADRYRFLLWSPQRELRASIDRIHEAARARYVASLNVDLEPPTGRQRRYC